MSRVRNKNTKVEWVVRRLVHSMGYRYRLHRPDLPGRPDLAFASRRKVIFVHGCFWHRHIGCRLARMPKSKLQFWRTKLNQNARRDERNQAALIGMGWHCLTVWECELPDREGLARRITEFLDHEGDGTTHEVA